jgi:hypothetical protein
MAVLSSFGRASGATRTTQQGCGFGSRSGHLPALPEASRPNVGDFVGESGHISRRGPLWMRSQVAGAGLHGWKS